MYLKNAYKLEHTFVKNNLLHTESEHVPCRKKDIISFLMIFIATKRTNKTRRRVSLFLNVFLNVYRNRNNKKKILQESETTLPYVSKQKRAIARPVPTGHAALVTLGKLRPQRVAHRVVPQDPLAVPYHHAENPELGGDVGEATASIVARTHDVVALHRRSYPVHEDPRGAFRSVAHGEEFATQVVTEEVVGAALALRLEDEIGGSGEGEVDGCVAGGADVQGVEACGGGKY